MKRTPLKRKTPLKRSQKPLKRSPLRKVSPKQSKRLTAYSRLRKDYLNEHPVCQVKGCANPASDIHHMGDGVGPKRGSNTNNVDTWLATCRPCHVFIESNKSWARANGYLI